MTKDEFYRRADDVVGRFLVDLGFEASGGEYIRRAPEGRDRVLIVPWLDRGRFAVMLCFYPECTEIVSRLVAETGEPRGFPCGPYLTPAGVLRRESTWPAKGKDGLGRSLDRVVTALQDLGMPWLLQLRNPQLFSAAVDPNAVLDAALANECAGRVEDAEKYYREILRRYNVMFERYKPSTLSEFMKKEFVFVSIKLETNQELRAAFQAELNYYPDIKPLHSGT